MRGYSGADVSALQQLLRNIGFYTHPEITGYYGSATQEAVAAFQRTKGIPPLGGVGPQTRAALNALVATATSRPPASATSADARASLINTLLAQLASLQQKLAARRGTSGSVNTGTNIITRTLAVGSKGDDVITLQRFLITQNLLASDSATGYFGGLTEAAVQKFQSAHNLVSSGCSCNHWLWRSRPEHARFI